MQKVLSQEGIDQATNAKHWKRYRLDEPVREAAGQRLRNHRVNVKLQHFWQ